MREEKIPQEKRDAAIREESCGIHTSNIVIIHACTYSHKQGIGSKKHGNYMIQ